MEETQRNTEFEEPVGEEDLAAVPADNDTVTLDPPKKRNRKSALSGREFENRVTELMKKTYESLMDLNERAEADGQFATMAFHIVMTTKDGRSNKATLAKALVCVSPWVNHDSHESNLREEEFTNDLKAQHIKHLRSKKRCFSYLSWGRGNIISHDRG